VTTAAAAVTAGRNPKLIGSGMIDCIPQTGPCPIGCAECFYNGGRFYRTLDEPLLPTLAAAHGKIVRVNSGHDSNLQRGLVLDRTRQYVHKFYNTSLPQFDFDAGGLSWPVVFTCNGRQPHRLDSVPANVMFVRIRARGWDTGEQRELVRHYWQLGVPIVLTWMRYYSDEAIPASARELYRYRRHVRNSYWCLRPLHRTDLMANFAGMGVHQCGTGASSLCIDCGNCVDYYWRALERMARAGMPVVSRGAV